MSNIQLSPEQALRERVNPREMLYIAIDHPTRAPLVDAVRTLLREAYPEAAEADHDAALILLFGKLQLPEAGRLGEALDMAGFAKYLSVSLSRGTKAIVELETNEHGDAKPGDFRLTFLRNTDDIRTRHELENAKPS